MKRLDPARWICGFCPGLLPLLAVFPAYAGALSPNDQHIYRAAFASAQANNWVAARETAGHARDRLLGDVLHWLELTRSDDARFPDIAAFIEQHGDWPRQNILRERAERLSEDSPDSLAQAYFQKNPPRTPVGELHLAEIMVRSGQGETAATLVRKAWMRPDLDADTEQTILDRFGRTLRAEDHIARLDGLIWEGPSAAARRQLQRVPEDHRLLAEARLALARAEPHAQEYLTRVPPYLQSDPGLLLERARWSRRQNRLEAAAAILMTPPLDLTRPDAWQRERLIVARRLLDHGQDGLAYDLISRRDLAVLNVKRTDGEFLSGWISLRRLEKPRVAYGHFVEAYAAAESPADRSRAAYWAGRATDASAMEDASRGWFATAAEHVTTYYGQLAAERLGARAEPAPFRDPHADRADIAAFNADVMVRVVRMLAEIGESRLAKPFLVCLMTRARTPVERKLAAALAEKTGYLDVAVLAAMRQSVGGGPLIAYGFPIIPIDQSGAAEPALVLAILRQESAFNRTAISHANAQGLMQLLPSTASQIATSLSLPFSSRRLLTDATYNVTLGRAYLDQMLSSFNGSYLLSIAAYNAGPANVRRWITIRGDPALGSVDVVDWVELIPLDETRDYVQRVLENLQIYRLRLGNAERAFKLAQDLQLNDSFPARKSETPAGVKGRAEAFRTSSRSHAPGLLHSMLGWLSPISGTHRMQSPRRVARPHKKDAGAKKKRHVTGNLVLPH